MAFEHTRLASDSLSTLEKHIRQTEEAANGLLLVVAGSQDGTDFNFLRFQFQAEKLPEVVLQTVTNPLDTQDEMEAERTRIEATGRTVLYFSPIFDATKKINVAVCRNGPVAGLTVAATDPTQLPKVEAIADLAVTATEEFATKGSKSAFHGNSSTTTGLQGTKKTFANGSVLIEAAETLAARRGDKDFGSKKVLWRLTTNGNNARVEQPDYCWLQRTLPDAILAADFAGFPEGIRFVTGKATRFGKKDPTDEGTGSELLKVVQTNSDVFGASVKLSRLTATFGAPLAGKEALSKALIEIYHPKSRKFARVPIVDVGPREDLAAELDLTFALDEFLNTAGSALVQFRIVV